MSVAAVDRGMSGRVWACVCMCVCVRFRNSDKGRNGGGKGMLTDLGGTCPFGAVYAINHLSRQPGRTEGNLISVTRIIYVSTEDRFVHAFLPVVTAAIVPPPHTYLPMRIILYVLFTGIFTGAISHP